MSTLPLITKYRPQSFEEIVGNSVAVQSLRDAIAGEGRPRTYLFSGPAGLGKTTLARIIAQHLDALLIEIAVAAANGVDDTKLLVEQTSFTTIAGSGNILYILDECHAYSAQAWKPLLKVTEEPPKGLYFAFCTTELAKIPDAIRTRCFHVPLKPLRSAEIEELLLPIAEIEGWVVNQSVLSAIVQASTGQPRKALSLLQAAHAFESVEQVAQVASEIESEKSPVVELCKYMLNNGKDWPRIRTYLSEIEADEDSFAAASRYIYAVMLKADGPQAKTAWTLLDALTYPRTVWDKKIHLGVVIGAMIWTT